METKNVIYELRTERGMSQDELAEKLFVTRQAVSRWENGETVPNTETLKLLSRLFDVSINTLLGSPRQLVCQCCGMPLEEASLSREPDGAINEDYCKWCYADGKFVYTSMDKLIDFCAEHMASEQWPAGQVRAYHGGTPADAQALAGGGIRKYRQKSEPCGSLFHISCGKSLQGLSAALAGSLSRRPV